MVECPHCGELLREDDGYVYCPKCGWERKVR